MKRESAAHGNRDGRWSVRGWRLLAGLALWCFVLPLMRAESIQITHGTTSLTGTRDVVSNLIFEHDLGPASPITLTTVVAGFPASGTPKLANVIKLLEDGAVVAVIAAPSADDFANNSSNDISYIPTSPGAKTLVVQATNGETTVSSAAIRVNVYGVAINAPAADGAAPAGSDLFISGPALLRNGVVATVQFFIDGNLAGIDTNAPYAVAWRPTTLGAHTLLARVTTSEAAMIDSPPITFTVVPAVANGTLGVNLTSPSSGATVAAGTTVTVAADARLTNSNGTISQVQFYLNGTALGDAVTAFPFTTTWKPAVAGNYVLTAIATDDKANTRASAGAVVTVTGNIPAVVLTHPANNAIVVAGGGVSLTAVPSGQDGSAGTVSSVEFFVDGNSVGSATTAPFIVVWSPTLARVTPYSITARVIATNGAQVSSDPALVTVIAPNIPPTVVLSTSNGSAPVPAGKAVTLTAVAADQTGSTATVARVDFLIEGTPIGTTSSAPYTVTWTPVVARDTPYTAQARVTLRNGLTALSAPVSVQVVANASPTVAIAAPIEGQGFTLGTPITLVATAGDADGTIANVQFFANNAAVGAPVTVAPFTKSFVPSAIGKYTLAARATDDTGRTTFSRTISIDVHEAVGQSPSAFISIVPDSGTGLLQKYFTAGSLLSIGIGASDPDGTVARVSLFFDGTRVATFDHEPYTTTLSLPSSADLFTDHTFSAIIEDDDGNQANAAETVVVVSSSRTLPTVSLVSPAAGAIFNYGTAVTVEAQLATSAVTIKGVVFAENGITLQTVTAPPYKITYVPGSSGSKSVTAIAYYDWTITNGVGETLVTYGVTTTAGRAVNFTVKDFSPTSDAESFVSQTYLDVLQRAPSVLEVNAGASALGSGTMTRAQLAASLVNSAGFADSSSALAAAWIITRQWPSYANYAATVAAIRSAGLAAACGDLLASNEYTATYGPTPTAASLTGANSYANLQAFATQLYQNALGRNPSLAEIQAVANAPSTTTQAGGISVVGLNSFLAEFVAKNSAGLAARTRAAGLYLGLLHQPPTTAQIVAMAAQPDLDTAGVLLADERYAGRFLSVTQQPQNLVLASGATGQLHAEVSGTAPFGYQWYRNGAIVPGGTRSTLTLRNVTATTAGNYYVVVTSTTSRVVSRTAQITVSNGFARLANLSSRAHAGPGDDSLIAGFVVGGSETKPLLLRGVGPGLLGQGMAGALADPRVELNTTETRLAANDDWGSSQAAEIEAAASRLGAFALTRGSRDAALLSTLAPGVYSLLTTNATGSPGIAIAEIYDAGAETRTARLVNLSTRARAGTGDEVMIAGFVISGNVSKRVLIRAVGPGLTALGVPGALTHPQLTLTSAGVRLAANDNWSASPDATAIATVGAQVGAFPLVAGSLDAAVLVSLPPGAYSAVVNGAGGTTGIVLVEVYDAG